MSLLVVFFFVLLENILPDKSRLLEQFLWENRLCWLYQQTLNKKKQLVKKKIVKGCAPSLSSNPCSLITKDGCALTMLVVSCRLDSRKSIANPKDTRTG